MAPLKISCRSPEMSTFFGVTIKMDAETFKYNYCYVKELKRYYFIQTPVVYPNGIITLPLVCDVLMSFKDTIEQIVGTIGRRSNPDKYNSGFNAQYDTRPGVERHDFENNFNEDGNIIGIDLEQPLHEGASKSGYSLIEITPKQYDLDRESTETRYAVWFGMEYTPGTDESKVTEITKIKLGEYSSSLNYIIGLQKNSKGDIVLVAANSWDVLAKPTIEIELNAGSKIVDAKTWLTKPAYYTVEVLNKSNLTTSHYGKVLGLDETYGAVAWVAPENIDLTKPEGQFAIDENYMFTNREN